MYAELQFSLIYFVALYATLRFGRLYILTPQIVTRVSHGCDLTVGRNNIEGSNDTDNMD